MISIRTLLESGKEVNDKMIEKARITKAAFDSAIIKLDPRARSLSKLHASSQKGL